ncbi:MULTISPECIES: transposase [Streptomyces]|uniref:transposase n=1 Tax=Streptomyces TaxID=1883 RepID=UPI0033321E67
MLIYRSVWSLERAVFTAVVYVLTAGCAWRHLPPTFGTFPATAHRRFTIWTEAGPLRRLHGAVLDRQCRSPEVRIRQDPAPSRASTPGKIHTAAVYAGSAACLRMGQPAAKNVLRGLAEERGFLPVPRRSALTCAGAPGPIPDPAPPGPAQRGTQALRRVTPPSPCIAPSHPPGPPATRKPTPPPTRHPGEPLISSGVLRRTLAPAGSCPVSGAR